MSADDCFNNKKYHYCYYHFSPVVYRTKNFLSFFILFYFSEKISCSYYCKYNNKGENNKNYYYCYYHHHKSSS